MSEAQGCSAPFRIDPRSGRVVQVGGAEKVKENLVVLLLTSVGERFMRRDYGAGLRELVHEPAGEALDALLERRIAAAVGRFEPRVALEDVLVERRDGRVVAELVYRLRDDGATDRVAVPLDGDVTGGT